ncbi:dehydrodolichyl diphosphate synthase complex subunit Nus1-like isoform X1 [Iris pallida]|uniref:ditrans,polycis-polyprenyl diphosphate synthase [(2E,6E)-farnesyldiphosphate specific] n=1 Tax=Iris pallida TaxID=29817 RepID=A0AAX6EX14_IRIPA|nr:dehydrodolichyl diphosphate synthase complex subunit Nus1-like isoform X1 [Iris pallida]
MVLIDEMEILSALLSRINTSMVLGYILGFFWCLLHLLVSIMLVGSHLIQVLVYYVISSGFIQKYQNFQLHKLRYLAVVIDSEDAKNTKQVQQLLQWLITIGVKYVTLYDMEGVLKKYLGGDSSSLNKSCSDADEKPVISIINQGNMTIELLSFSDGKEAVAKASTFLCSNYLKGDAVGCNKIEPTFTESDISAALKIVGYGGPDPDLLLVYGTARCHLGFPAWRIRYTEIVHMGPLKSMNYGAIVKAIYDFSKKHQNYGT